jgi:hypothetical protein
MPRDTTVDIALSSRSLNGPSVGDVREFRSIVGVENSDA